LLNIPHLQCFDEIGGSSLKDFPLLKKIDDIDIMILMLDPNVFSYVGLDLAHVVAVGTLEPRLLATLIAKMARQVPFPREDAPTIRIRTRKLDVS